MAEIGEPMVPQRADNPPHAVNQNGTVNPNRAAKPKRAEIADRTMSERLLDLSRERMVDGIILSEVLGKPVSMRRRQPR